MLKSLAEELVCRWHIGDRIPGRGSHGARVASAHLAFFLSSSPLPKHHLNPSRVVKLTNPQTKQAGANSLTCLRNKCFRSTCFWPRTSRSVGKEGYFFAGLGAPRTVQRSPLTTLSSARAGRETTSSAEFKPVSG